MWRDERDGMFELWRHLWREYKDARREKNVMRKARRAVLKFHAHVILYRWYYDRCKDVFGFDSDASLNEDDYMNGW